MVSIKKNFVNPTKSAVKNRPVGVAKPKPRCYEEPMTTKIYSCIPFGFEGKIVEVEADSNRGLPAFNIVGMANKTINEAIERVRSAIANSKLKFPDQKVTVNLAPADLAKDGSFLDLPIALSILTLSHHLLPEDTKNRLFVGELSLDGQLRPIKGIINIVETAKNQELEEVYIPFENLGQASLVTGIKIYGVKDLKSLVLHLRNIKRLDTHVQQNIAQKSPNMSPSEPFLDQIYGQSLAKRALEIAIAGHHNLLISGPPGAGKTMLARVAKNLLPDPSPEEQIEITKLASMSGQNTSDIIAERPFRHPHHTASTSSIIGGGTLATPGEISLATKGVLFLDEVPEFKREVLESLRQPLEDKKITVSRLNQRITYPADFMLIATMNPCPCGYNGDPTHKCTCSPFQIQQYQKKLSGPLFDRIDMNLTVEKVKNTDLIKAKITDKTEHIVVKNAIKQALELQAMRYHSTTTRNGTISSTQVVELLTLTPKARSLLNGASSSLNLSARSYFKTIKVARTIADLENAPEITPCHIAEALTFRKR